MRRVEITVGAVSLEHLTGSYRHASCGDRRYFLLLMGGLIVLAWLTLWLWGQSPYGRLLNHDELSSADLGNGSWQSWIDAGDAGEQQETGQYLVRALTRIDCQTDSAFCQS